MEEDIIFDDNFKRMNNKNIHLYCTHALCHEGEASFLLAEKSFHMKQGDCIIFPHNELVSEITETKDFKATIVYISNHFLLNNMPKNEYDVIGKLTLLRNPIIPLTKAGQQIFMEDIETIRKRTVNTAHHFYNELMGCLVDTFVLDLYDFHAQVYGNARFSGQQALLMKRFIEMLSNKEYQKHREVSYYASKLCVTPKYLSEVCKKISGSTANFWIDHFTIVAISRLLADKSLALKEIAEQMNFSSLSFFSRYVQRLLKVSPSEYRGNNL